MLFWGVFHLDLKKSFWSFLQLENLEKARFCAVFYFWLKQFSLEQFFKLDKQKRTLWLVLIFDSNQSFWSFFQFSGKYWKRKFLCYYEFLIKKKNVLQLFWSYTKFKKHISKLFLNKKKQVFGIFVICNLKKLFWAVLQLKNERYFEISKNTFLGSFLISIQKIVYLLFFRVENQLKIVLFFQLKMKNTPKMDFFNVFELRSSSETCTFNYSS